MLASLLIVVVLAAVALVVIKRFGPKVGISTGQQIKVLDSAHLSPRRTVHLVEVGGVRFLLGATRDRITRLGEVPSPPAQAEQDDKE